jgi:hypothetical protein
MPNTCSLIVQKCLGVLMLLVLQSPALAHSLQANYIPWGVDEYEFFGLAAPQLAKDFNGKMEFEQGFTKKKKLCSFPWTD